jgi:hypothetical protein
MTKSDMITKYSDLTAEDRRSFDRWLRANVAIASIVALGLFAMAVASGPSTPGPRSASAQGARGIDVSAVAKNHMQNEVLSVEELMLRMDLNALPETKVDEPY